jgi:hypothetical protein
VPFGGREWTRVQAGVLQTGSTAGSALQIAFEHTPHSDSLAVPGAVRFLSAVFGADYCKLLMALDCGSGEPRRNRTFNPQIKSRIKGGK